MKETKKEVKKGKEQEVKLDSKKLTDEKIKDVSGGRRHGEGEFDDYHKEGTKERR